MMGETMAARISELEAALRALEWGHRGRVTGRSMCLICEGYRDDGHGPNCIVGNALKGVQV
jgi:hypothetical protein